MLWWWWSKSFFMFLTFVTTFRLCKFEVYITVDGRNNKEEENMEVADIRMYHLSAEILHTSIVCSTKWIFRNNYELVHLWLVSGLNLYHWTNSNDIEKIRPNFAFGICQKSLVYYSSLLAPYSSFSILMIPWTLMMSLDTHFCTVKHLKVPNISRADHIPALIEEHSYWSDT